MRDSRIVRYNSGIGGQSRNSHFAQVQFRNHTDSHLARTNTCSICDQERYLAFAKIKVSSEYATCRQKKKWLNSHHILLRYLI